MSNTYDSLDTEQRAKITALDGMRRHKFLDVATMKRLPALYANESKGEDETTVQAKWFDPSSGWTWYATEFDPTTGTFFGLVVGHETELGYYHMGELGTITGRVGLPIERDCYFTPITLKAARALHA